MAARQVKNSFICSAAYFQYPFQIRVFRSCRARQAASVAANLLFCDLELPLDCPTKYTVIHLTNLKNCRARAMMVLDSVRKCCFFGLLSIVLLNTNVSRIGVPCHQPKDSNHCSLENSRVLQPLPRSHC